MTYVWRLNQGRLPSNFPLTCKRNPRRRRQYLVQQIHELGAGVMFELIDDIGRHPGFGDNLDQLLERYASRDGTVGAVARAPARELRHSENSQKEPPDAGAPYQGEQNPRAVSRGDGK